MPLRILSRVKGEISLQVPDKPYRGGDLLDLGVHVRARTRLGPGRLFGVIVCGTVVQEWHTARDGTRTMRRERQELFRDEIDIARDVEFAAGSSQTLRVMSEIPDPWRPQDRGDDTPHYLDQLQRIRTATRQYDRTIHWVLAARLDVPGLDLTDQQRLQVQLTAPKPL